MAQEWQRWLATGLAGSLFGIGYCQGGAIAQSPSSPNPPAPDATEPNPTDPAPETQPDSQTEAEVSARFTCQLQNGQYTVMYSPKSQPTQSYPWATPGDLGSAWPAERRCNEISRRLESYRPDGLLELRTGMENGYETVCVTTEAVPSCRIVFTVPPGQDAIATRDRVFNNLVLADQGQATQGVSTLIEQGSILDNLGNVLGLPAGHAQFQTDAIDLQPFLDPADGGTGAQLTPSQGRRLNPNNF